MNIYIIIYWLLLPLVRTIMAVTALILTVTVWAFQWPAWLWLLTASLWLVFVAATIGAKFFSGPQ